ncbi:MAG: pre-rRNA processing protein [Thelocarpon superellum]|nr:MAG: pre-rRNA processing protein [Thelocarpon superellum]
MSSFFTLPASQRKRKRGDGNPSSSVKKSAVSGAPAPTTRPPRDESISGSDAESGDDRPQPSDSGEDEGSSGSEHDGETAADRRLRLAERYLENIRQEVDDVGFDAEQIDKDLIAERLREDVAETKGRLYRHIAHGAAFNQATLTRFRANTNTTTSIAIRLPHVYTVSKDRTLIKWALPSPPPPAPAGSTRKPHPARKRPKQVAFRRGLSQSSESAMKLGHTSNILAVACSPDGRYVVTGGQDRRVIIWAAADLAPLKAFSQHRDAVVALAFRRGTNQLYSASRDRTIKLWSLDELAYVETLFGHQDEVVDVATLAQERCVSVGARDRTARLWKVVDETQLVFRGGTSNHSKKDSKGPTTSIYAEGSIDRVALVDEETFVTGSDNGSLCLWTLHKKKPVFTLPLAHGVDPPLPASEASAETHPPSATSDGPRMPRWITALATLPYSDIIVSGSWDGYIRAWRVTADKKRIEAVGVVGAGASGGGYIPGIINDLAICERHDSTTPAASTVQVLIPEPETASKTKKREREKDKEKNSLILVAATGTEHRLGEWMRKLQFPSSSASSTSTSTASIATTTKTPEEKKEEETLAWEKQCEAGKKEEETEQW